MSLPGGLEPSRRARVEEYVRPLHKELDGVDTFAAVERLERRLADLATRTPHDAELLELMVLFHGVVPRLGSLATGGRWQLFLRGLGLTERRVAALRTALGRFRQDPRTAEEALLHDALLLASTGVRAAVGQLLAAGRRKLSLQRALATLEPGPEPERFRTAEARRLASARRSAADGWIADLRARIAAEESS